MVLPTASHSSFTEIWKRLIAGLVLGPPALAALYFGSPFSDLLIIGMSAGMAWEWGRLCGAGSGSRTLVAMIASVVLAGIATALGVPAIAGWILAVGVMIGLLVSRNETPEPVWIAVGIATIGLASLSLLWLRADAQWGRSIILWLVAVVWATDTGAYFAGRSLGGPKLAPRISPKKTWSGLGGGVLAAGVVGWTTAYLLEGHGTAILVVASMLLAIISQAGDLFESMLKRRFGVKDSSKLIPGHGGLLDRTDGLIAASLCVAAFIWFAGEARF